MNIFLTRMFEMRGGTYGILSYENTLFWTMEKEWVFNRKFDSCVPTGEYELSVHNGKKYKDTWALIGNGVSHTEEPGIPRFACVFHRAMFPRDLAGCIAVAKSISPEGFTIQSEDATMMFLYDLNERSDEVHKLYIYNNL